MCEWVSGKMMTSTWKIFTLFMVDLNDVTSIMSISLMHKYETFIIHYWSIKFAKKARNYPDTHSISHDDDSPILEDEEKDFFFANFLSNNVQCFSDEEDFHFFSILKDIWWVIEKTFFIFFTIHKDVNKENWVFFSTHYRNLYFSDLWEFRRKIF